MLNKEPLIEVLDLVNQMSNKIDELEITIEKANQLRQQLSKDRFDLLTKIGDLIDNIHIEISYERIQELIKKYPRIINLLRHSQYGHTYRECHVILHIALWNPPQDYLRILEDSNCKNWIEYIKKARQENKHK